MKTKRILSILLAALTIVAALLSLAACGAKDSGVDYSVTDAARACPSGPCP